MKALSLMQPWATLVAIGEKQFETRSRNWTYRGDFLIHASKKMNDEAKRLARTDLVKNICSTAGIEELQLGKIIGIATIEGSYETQLADDFFFEQPNLYPTGKLSQKAIEIEWDINVKREKALGDYSPGRYFYELHSAKMFKHFVPVNGSVILGWDFDPRICVGCGCTEENCSECIAADGHPCYWVNDHLCSSCHKRIKKSINGKK